MADQKASILMGACFVVLTLVVNQILSQGAAPLPLLALGGFTAGAGLLAAYAIMPSASTRGRRMTQNPLFFGGFAELDWPEYVREMSEVMRSDEQVFTTMVRDIYELGQVLYHRKYRFLRYSYMVFVSGALVTVVLTLFMLWSGL